MALGNTDMLQAIGTSMQGHPMNKGSKEPRWHQLTHLKKWSKDPKKYKYEPWANDKVERLNKVEELHPAEQSYLDQYNNIIKKGKSITIPLMTERRVKKAELKNNKYREEKHKTDKYKYCAICLRNKTLNKLDNLSSTLVKDEKLSRARTVEALIKKEKIRNPLEKGLERISNGKTTIQEA